MNTRNTTELATMRKLIMTLVIATGLAALANGQMSMVMQLASTNGNEICYGLSAENSAMVKLVTPPPLPVPSTAVLNYTWTAQHANGSWTWHTNHPERMVPIPFPGLYTIQVRVEYVRRTTGRPFAAFWSNKLFVMGIDCNN